MGFILNPGFPMLATIIKDEQIKGNCWCRKYKQKVKLSLVQDLDHPSLPLVLILSNCLGQFSRNRMYHCATCNDLACQWSGGWPAGPVCLPVIRSQIVFLSSLLASWKIIPWPQRCSLRIWRRDDMSHNINQILIKNRIATGRWNFVDTSNRMEVLVYKSSIV